jgi:hypothetical protein
MALLLFHWVKPEEDDDEAKDLTPPEIRDQLVEFFKEEYEDIESFLELKNTSQELKFHEYVTAIRRIVVEILVSKCGMEVYQFQSRDLDEVFMKLTCKDEILKQ